MHLAHRAGSGLHEPYTGPPPTGLPKSESLNSVPRHDSIASTILPGRSLRRGHGMTVDGARYPAAGPHGTAVPRTLCEGACKRWVARVRACIVGFARSVRFSVVVAPEGENKKGVAVLRLP